MRRKCLLLLCLALIVSCIDYLCAQEAGKVTSKGKVVDTLNRPITGFRVKLYELAYNEAINSYEMKSTVEETTTKKDGGYLFSVSADRDGYTYGIIVAQKEGLAIGWVNWFMWENQECDIKLGEPKAIAGVVVDTDDKPIPYAQVSILGAVVGEGNRRRDLPNPVALSIFTTKTNELGKFTFSGLHADATIEFLVKKPGLATISTFSPQADRGEKLQFAAGQSDIKLVIPPETIVEGIVVEKGDGKLVGGVKIIVLQEENKPIFGQESIVSKEDGTFSINALPVSKLTIQLIKPKEGLTDWVAEQVPVTTEAGKTASGVKVEVSKGGVLQVVITEEETKEPIEKVLVRIREQKNQQQYFSAHSGKDGVAQIRLLPGEYQIEAVYKEKYAQSSRQETVTIKEGEITHIEWQLAAAPKITGMVRNQTGKPVGGVILKIHPPTFNETTSNSQGKFEIYWDRRGWGGSDEGTQFCLVARHTERNLAAATIVDENTKTADIKLAAGLTIAGRVVDPNGKGISGARVLIMLRVSNWGSSLGRDIETGEGGNFEMKALPAEQKYSVYASAEEYGEKSFEVDSGDAVNNRLEVKALTLAVANLSVSGVVVDVNDKPVANAKVYCSGEGQQHHETHTDAEGKFTLGKICPGKVNVLAWGKGQLNGSVQTEGGARDVKIVISAEERGESRFIPKQPPSLAGKALPELKEFGIELSAADVNDRMILVCFWDMNQRPSRNCITKLTEQAKQLKEKGIIIVAIQSTNIDEAALNGWVKKNNISFALGMVTGDEEEIRFAWGAKSLPWLILTDRKHIVSAEGFSLAELDEKIKAITQK